MKRKDSGFTLLELMIVIAIIGILAAIAIPQYVVYMNAARAQDVAADYKEAVQAVTNAYAAADAGQTTNIYDTLNSSAHFKDAADPVNNTVPAFVFGNASTCGQVAITASSITPSGPAQVVVSIDDGCSGALTLPISNAVSAEGFPDATTTGVVIDSSGKVTA